MSRRALIPAQPANTHRSRGWPARSSTKVLGRDGLSKEQKNWHLNWRNWGGTSLIVVGVGEEVFAFSGERADEVNDYNTMAKAFPTVLYARLLGFKAEQPYFEAPAADRQRPNVDFSK